MKRRYVVLTLRLAVGDPSSQSVHSSRRFWTRRRAERWARLYERESWRRGVLADAWVAELDESGKIPKEIEPARPADDA